MPVSLTANEPHQVAVSGVSAPSLPTRSPIIAMLRELAGVAQKVERLWRTLVTSARMVPRSSGQFDVQRVRRSSRPAAAPSRPRLATRLATSNVLQVQVHLAGLDLGEVENVVDQRQQVLARSVDLLEVGDEVVAGRRPAPPPAASRCSR